MKIEVEVVVKGVNSPLLPNRDAGVIMVHEVEVPDNFVSPEYVNRLAERVFRESVSYRVVVK